RYMKLLEVIPTADTDPGITQFVSDFAETRLGKSVVLCKDTPNFIANRLASMGGAVLMDFVLARDYTIEEVDAIVGPLIGRPKTAAFRLQDLVGLDVSSSVASNLYGLIPDDESREVLASPSVEALRKSQMDRGRLGDKTKQGFYKKDGKTIQTLDLKTGEYRERQEPDIPSLAEAAKIRELPKRVQFVLQQDDKAGALARHVIYHSLGYAARRVPEISDDIASIDRAVRWGFSHDLGPFELWDALGVQKTANAMEEYGVAVPAWVREKQSFYDRVEAAIAPAIRENPSASLRDLGDGVLQFEIHTKMNTLDEGVREMLEASVDELERGDWKGMVIGNDGEQFSVGANLRILNPDSIGTRVRNMQDAFMRVRFATKPIVAAPFGRTLAGGCELALSAARIVAAGETYMGLVEVGVGLIPGAGGCKELIRRVVSPAMKHTPNADSLPHVQNVLQTIGMAKVSSSAAEARELGYLAESDRIVMNRDHLLREAKQEVLELAANGYVPPARETSCYAAGRDVRAALKAGIYVLRQGGYISEFDAFVTGKLAHILSGGELSHAEWVDEQYFLDLEREVFVELAAHPKTQERITYMLETGKALRN
ncbi:MAG TPA: 3-hydroxyacyl-CoA dehydrogenase family protein, partial [Thermoanaerobaculia bacterium]|nr:3-hydroxyacyl-CoA dehydrogenase family protein [Thermoanaerobaculia bacterium]